MAWTEHETGASVASSNNDATLTIKDANFVITDDSDTTKRVKFQASGVTTATTRTLTVPDADLTVVGTATTQTLTNKTIAAANNTITIASTNLSDVATLATLTGTQTLTNKTITAAANTLTIASTNLSDSSSLVRMTTGSTSCENTVATTLFAASTAGRYDIVANIADAGTQYLSFATVVNDGTNARIVADNGANLTLTLSGTNVQAAQSSGGTASVAWRYSKL